MVEFGRMPSKSAASFQITDALTWVFPGSSGAGGKGSGDSGSGELGTAGTAYSGRPGAHSEGSSPPGA